MYKWILAVGLSVLSTYLWGNTPPQSLNAYVDFLNHSTQFVNSRINQIQAYSADAILYRSKPQNQLTLASSGPLETYYLQTAIEAQAGLNPQEVNQLKKGAQAIWQQLEKIDQSTKALETYIRLKQYQQDGLKRSDELLLNLQALTSDFSQEQVLFYGQVQKIYRRYQPYTAQNPYLRQENQLRQILDYERQTFTGWPYYLQASKPANSPIDRLKQGLLATEDTLNHFNDKPAGIAYPASSTIPRFKEALRSFQQAKRTAINDYTFAASQSAQYSNTVYQNLVNYYNNDLIASYQSFVLYSVSAKTVLKYSLLCTTFVFETTQQAAQPGKQTKPFTDSVPIPFSAKPAATLISPATFAALKSYVLCINESLRQLNTLQLIVENYQQAAEYYRDPVKSRQRSQLTYSHEAFTIPAADFALVNKASQAIPAPYRVSINAQSATLLSMLQEMDSLSIDLIAYTKNQQYLQDNLRHSDAILNRYAVLFTLFDQKKERLYEDVRRIYESYPAKQPASAWQLAGKALLQAMDLAHGVFFGLKAYLKQEVDFLPATDSIKAVGQTLIANEYTNLKGLTRYGRSNGLCPYSPYEDMAENSIRFADKVNKVKTASSTPANQYRDFYFFYNNELVYQYNKFCELAQTPLLPTIKQPNLLAFQRKSPPSLSKTPTYTNTTTRTAEQVAKSANTPPLKPTIAGNTVSAPQKHQRDTVFVERTRTDTVYIEREVALTGEYSLKGFAPNNMILLLDVSASMNSPVKLPLLKKSIKSLLKLFRSEDQLSIVVYSGKAKVILKPTAGTEAAQIARVIDQLESDGGTDGNNGIKLAYKLANKNYIRGGNNRIILATDGEFPISNAVYQSVAENAQQDIFLTVFTFNRREVNAANLKKLATLGKGTYAHVTTENADIRFVLEARAKKMP